MKRLRVVAPLGATIRGPARIALTPDQHRRRIAVLGKARARGVYDLGSGVAITLKCGEEFGLDIDERLNKALFEEVLPEAAPSGGADTTPGGAA